MREKGIVAFEGMDRRVVFQGVHMAMGSHIGRPRASRDARESTFIFIGPGLPKAEMLAALDRCLVPTTNVVTESIKLSLENRLTEVR